jgi:hypothetical protein
MVNEGKKKGINVNAYGISSRSRSANKTKNDL